MSVPLPGWLRQVGARIRLALRILNACLRHLAGEDAWARHLARQTHNCAPAARGSADTAHCPRHGSPQAEQERESADPAPAALDRGRFWQEESERRWNGVRRCC
jgi:hypothetical protein